MADTQSYSVGNLEIAIQGNSKDAIDSISNVIKSLDKLSKALNVFSQADISKVSGNISSSFDGIANALTKINGADISKLSDLSKATNYIKLFANSIQKIDTRVIYGKIDGLFRGISSAVNRIDEKTFDKIVRLSTAIGELKGATQSLKSAKFISSTSVSGGGEKSGLFGLLKWGTIIAFARRFARIGAQILQYGVDYTETLNLWQVAMRGNLDTATEYVKKMREAYGISEKTLMNAQAIFKNMLSSMGNLTDEAAYKLSESVTKMAIDYASLYNVQISDAITKFQAALAGQVRPIRSTSGYDITENTLYQLYQSMGGTKTMRQLSQTERRLLAIYAIFRQMDETGALGDMEKTLDNFANQSRMLTENWKEFATWVGISMQYFLQQSGIMVKLNAALSLAADLAKSFAYSMGYVDPDFGLVFADGMEEASEETEKLKGKLLGFDKFRSLNQTEDSLSDTLGIDETIVKAMENYRMQVDASKNAAEQLKKKWADMLGLVDENGDGIYDYTQKMEVLKDIIAVIGISLGLIFALGLIGGIGKLIVSVTKLGAGLSLLAVVIIAGIIVALYKAIKAFKEGDNVTGLLASAIVTLLVPALALLKKASLSTSIGLGALAAAAMGAMALILNWGDMSTWQRIIGIIGVATTAILGLAMALGAFHSAWSMGAAVAGIVAGITMMTIAIATVKKDAKEPVTFMAEGGLPDRGTLFYAGEAGAEMVYN
ncbi:MAG: hypothetical protein IKU25_05095, partial [Clostridia bacterium]|nr:hypothetical protein [Clostridia bacterium]